MNQNVNDMEAEIWKDIVGYEGRYKVSSLGKVLSLRYCGSDKSHLLSPNPDHKGYLMIYLSKNGETKTFHIHRLVAKAFIPNPNNLPQVNHKDENKQNNSVENLEWCDGIYNINYGTGIKRRTETAKKSDAHILHIKKLHNANKIPILMIDKNTKGIIKRYDCGQAAADELHISKSSIYQVCKGRRKTVGGYMWKYEHLVGTTDKPKED